MNLFSWRPRLIAGIAWAVGIVFLMTCLIPALVSAKSTLAVLVGMFLILLVAYLVTCLALSVLEASGFIKPRSSAKDCVEEEKVDEEAKQETAPAAPKPAKSRPAKSKSKKKKRK